MSEVETAEGTGSAYNAQVLTDIPTGDLEAALAQRRADYEADALNRNVAGLEASRAKILANLANVESALEAARAAAEGGAES